MAAMTYGDLPETRVRAGRGAYPIKAATDVFDGGLVGIEAGAGTLVPWGGGTDPAAILFLGFLLCHEIPTGLQQSETGTPNGSVNENGDTMRNVAVSGGTGDQTDVGLLVECASDNWRTDLAVVTTGVALGRISKYNADGSYDVEFFTPAEYEAYHAA